MSSAEAAMKGAHEGPEDNLQATHGRVLAVDNDCTKAPGKEGPVSE